jgi:hypothetical protein
MAMVLGSALAASVSGIAKADVIYNLTFKVGSTTVGTGTVDLNLPTIASAANLSQNLHSILVSITTTSIDGHGGFTITPANMIQSGATGADFIQSSGGILNTLSAMEVGASPILDLNLFTNSWNISQGTNGGFVEGGTLIVTGPTLAAAPVPGPLVGAGLPGLVMAIGGWFALRGRRQKVA